MSTPICNQQISSTAEKWILTNNVLACRTNIDVEDIAPKYQSLWNIIKGVPVHSGTIQLELTVVCTLCQVKLLQTLQGLLHDSSIAIVDYISAVTTRVSKFLNVPEKVFPDNLSFLFTILGLESRDQILFMLLLRMSFVLCVNEFLFGDETAAAVVLCLLIESPPFKVYPSKLDTSQSDVFQQIALVKSYLERNPSPDLTFNKAWICYTEGKYTAALDILSSNCCQLNNLQHLYVNLLTANCFANLQKPNLALCVYHRCLSFITTSEVNSVLANCCLLYSKAGKLQAEVDMRKLLVRALMKSTDHGQHCIVWRDNLGGLSMHRETLSVYKMACSTAIRAIAINRPSCACLLLQDLSCGIDNICSRPLAHLLYAQALICCGRFDESWTICSRLMEAFQSSVYSQLSSNLIQCHEVMILVQTYYLAALTAVKLYQINLGKLLAQRCLRLLELISSHMYTIESWKSSLKHFSSVKEVCSTLLCVIFIGEGRPDKGLQILIEAAAITTNPRIQYNHCLLLAKDGHIHAASQTWLLARDLLPQDLADRRQKLQSIKEQSPVTHKELHKFDIMMLQVWLK